MNRRVFLRNVGTVFTADVLGRSAWSQDHHTAQRPNVVFIAIDDQNDWVGPLGGHPMAKTPNLDRLAARGTTFLNAHVQSPLCNPSRTSLMLSLRPTTTGIYGLAPWFRTLPQWQDRVTLPQHFKAHGYRTFTAGKIYHGGAGGRKKRTIEFDEWGPPSGIGARPKKKLIPPTPMGNHPLMDWGVFPHRDQDKQDYKVASWAVDQIRSMPKDQPFFLAAGFFLPHVPCYATQKWFDLYPDDDSILPRIKGDHRDDTPRFSWYLHWSLPEPRLKWVRDNKQWRNLVRSYLACTSFVDAQVGRILDALDTAGSVRSVEYSTPSTLPAWPTIRLSSCGATTAGIWVKKGSPARIHYGSGARVCRSSSPVPASRPTSAAPVPPNCSISIPRSSSCAA